MGRELLLGRVDAQNVRVGTGERVQLGGDVCMGEVLKRGGGGEAYKREQSKRGSMVHGRMPSASLSSALRPPSQYGRR